MFTQDIIVDLTLTEFNSACVWLGGEGGMAEPSQLINRHRYSSGRL